MPRTRDMRGFTLLEMLVAMAIMSVLAGSLYATMGTAFAGRRAAERALEPPRRAAAAMTLLEQDFDAAVPPTGFLAAEFIGSDGVDDDGEPADSIELHVLTVRPQEAEPPSPLCRVELMLSTDEETGERALVRSVTVNLLAPEGPEPITQVLCWGARSFDVEYYDGADWLDTWDSIVQDDVLPLAVRVTLGLDVPGREDAYAITRTYALPCGSLAEEEEEEDVPAPGGGGPPR